jgi:hypothetical protein
LLANAERHVRALVDSATFLAPLEGQAPVAHQLYFNLHTFRSDDYAARAAILRAQLSREPADIAAAEAAVDGSSEPWFRLAAERAWLVSGDFCDSGDSENPEPQDHQILREACREDDAIQERVTSYWINRFILETVNGTSRSNDDHLAFHLLRHEQVQDRERCCRRSSEEDLLRMRLARADMNRRKFAAEIGQHLYPAIHAWDEALNDLEQAEHLVSPSDQPARFRRVAQSWLALWSEADRLDVNAEQEDRLADSARRRRYAVYLRQVLAGLNAVATGEGGAPH